MPCAAAASHAATVSHAVAWANASAKIVIATIAVETVVVVEPIVSRSKKREGMRAAVTDGTASALADLPDPAGAMIRAGPAG